MYFTVCCPAASFKTKHLLLPDAIASVHEIIQLFLGYRHKVNSIIQLVI